MEYKRNVPLSAIGNVDRLSAGVRCGVSPEERQVRAPRAERVGVGVAWNLTGDQTFEDQ